MFSKLSNKALTGIFLGLLAIVLVVTLIDNKKGERNFRDDLFIVDTANVEEIHITPRGKTDGIMLVRNGQRWTIKKDGETFNADDMMIENMLDLLEKMSPKRIAATDKSRWENFEVTDSLATLVTAKTDKGKTAKVYIGKFSYQQPKNQNPYQQYGGRPQGTMTSYVRVDDEKEVYAVDGFLSMSFNRGVNDLRDKTVVSGTRHSWNRLSFNYPDSSFTIAKENGKWMINGLMADSASVEGYLTSLSRLNSSNFVDNATPGSEVYSLKIEGDNMVNPIIVRADNDSIISTSLNSDTYFDGKQGGLFNKVFKGKSSLGN